MKLDELAGKPLTYTEVGATATTMPVGYHHLRKSSVIGRGRDRFEQAAAAGMRWGMLRGAGTADGGPVGRSVSTAVSS